MSEIRVEKELVMKKISEIKPYVRNPRKNDKTVEQLCKIIPIVGFNVPLTIDPDGVIIKGHARFTAAIRLGMTELPCIISHASPDEIKADRITDNKISELSEWVTDELKHELDMLNIDFDFSGIGLDVSDVDDIPSFEDFEPETPSGSQEISEEQRKKLYEEFLKQQEEQAEKEAEASTQMTTPAELEKAKEAQKQTATPPPRYYKCVCEKCGHIMFVREGDICDRVEEEE